MRKLIAVIVSLALVCAVLAGCTPHETNQETNDVELPTLNPQMPQQSTDLDGTSDQPASEQTASTDASVGEAAEANPRQEGNASGETKPGDTSAPGAASESAPASHADPAPASNPDPASPSPSASSQPGDAVPGAAPATSQPSAPSAPSPSTPADPLDSEEDLNPAGDGSDEEPDSMEDLGSDVYTVDESSEDLGQKP